MASKTNHAADQPDPQSLSFEQATEELEAIIDRIEQGEIGLQESLAERKRGEKLIHRCRAILDQAEQELEQMTVPEGAVGDGGDSSTGDDDIDAG